MKTYYLLYLIPLFFFMLPLLAASANDYSRRAEREFRIMQAARKKKEKEEKEKEKDPIPEAPRRKRGRPRKTSA